MSASLLQELRASPRSPQNLGQYKYMRDSQKRVTQQETKRSDERQEQKSKARTGREGGHRRPEKRGLQVGRGWPVVVPLTHR